MGVAKKIGAVAKEKDISLKKLSQIVGIPYTTLYHAVKRDSKVDANTVQKIAAALGMTPTELLGSDWGKIVAEDTIEKFKNTEYINVTTPTPDGSGYETVRYYNPIAEKERRRRYLEAFDKLNVRGQSIAVERVEELAQILKYQRQQDEPAGQGDEGPKTK